VIHVRLPYRIILVIGTLVALSACSGGDAKQAEVDALRQELAAIKHSQAEMQQTLAVLAKAVQATAALAENADAPGREVIHRIPTSYSPRKGDPITPVTVVEFADFQCPYCQAAAGLPDQLLKEFPTDVQFAFKHYPLGRHKDAFNAAKAAWAAQGQGKFWEMHDLIYGGDITQISIEELRGYAEKLGLDMARFDADMTSTKAAQMVGLDKQLGKAIKIAGTPAYFVNGRRAPDRSPATIRAMVAEEIAKLKQGAQS